MNKDSSYVVSLSGGKDSTALLLKMLEKGYNVVDIVFFDTGWEFPQMYKHLDKLEEFIDRKITRLHPQESLDYLFSDKIKPRSGKQGYGWPSAKIRWCTGIKRNAIRKYVGSLTLLGHNLPLVQAVGYAFDEIERTQAHNGKLPSFVEVCYPLIEWKITEQDALAYCKAKGFDWDGLYDHLQRVSCFCCPLQSTEGIKKIWKFYPKLWQRMLDMESRLVDSKNKIFRNKSITEWTKRFQEEENE